ncbi:hypothetical protein [Bacillus haynesii]|nr:hypothetical protein [Bacillus haynesii]MCY7912986.1 hypothetical protein [Bacillus haynesii]MCY7927190.1 hypothetical protein [Bacillus haynesii]MCY8771909.1 hypothetical protein [Bacillus haynesii]MEC0789381.1 hypothetical protein [Bacillus haynesii]MEC1653325.1 hypothetical protein [Bacillus haynesii]
MSYRHTFIHPSAGDYILPAKPTMEAAIMNHRQLDRYLRQLDLIEKIQIKTGENVPDFDGKELLVENDSDIPRLQENYFF